MNNSSTLWINIMSKFMLREKRDKEKNILNMYYVPNFICIFELNLKIKLRNMFYYM